MNPSSVLIARSVFGLALFGSALNLAEGQTAPAMPSAPTPAAMGQVAPRPTSGTAAATVPANGTLSLDQVIQQAQTNEPTFAQAIADSKVAQLDRSIARAGLLPSAVFHNQYLFTQANGTNDRIGQTTTSVAPIFIANNAVHEYASQGVVTETLGLAQYTAVSRPPPTPPSPLPSSRSPAAA